MPYCTHCGSEVEHVPEVAAAAIAGSDEVEIARIQAERDIEVAKISARQDRDYNETRVEVAELETVAELGAAEATAEALTEVLGAELEGEPAETVVMPEPEPEPAPEPEMVPPVADTPAPSPGGKKSSAWAFG